MFHLLLKDLHDSVLDAVTELWVREPILEKLFCADEILAIGVILWTKNDHQAKSVTLHSRATYSINERYPSALESNYFTSM